MADDPSSAARAVAEDIYNMDMLDDIARALDAFAARARAEERERCVQWHIVQSRSVRRSASEYPEDSDDRRDFLSQAIWHYDCVDAIRALPAPPTSEREG